MEQQVSFRFLTDVRNRLNRKGYIEVRPPYGNELAMMKQTFGGTLPKVVAFVDATFETNALSMIFKNHEQWFKQLLGNTGAGAIIFVINQPSAASVSEVSQLGKGFLGYGQVVAGIYDISTNKYWMSDHMGWPAEIFS